MLGFGFSGYLLPWNELSFFATKVGTGIAGAVPVVGHFMLRLLRGGDDVTGATLSRFYGLHVAILPAMTTALVARAPAARPAAGHERAARHRASAEGRASRCRRCRSSRTTSCATCWRGTSCWRCSRRWPRSIRGSSARRPIRSPSCPPGIRPEWYFLAMFHTLKLLPSHILGFEGEQLGVVAFGLVGARSWCSCRSSIGARAAASAARCSRSSRCSALVYLVVFTIIGHYAK